MEKDRIQYTGINIEEIQEFLGGGINDYTENESFGLYVPDFGIVNVGDWIIKRTIFNVHKRTDKE